MLCQGALKLAELFDAGENQSIVAPPRKRQKKPKGRNHQLEKQSAEFAAEALLDLSHANNNLARHNFGPSSLPPFVPSSDQSQWMKEDEERLDLILHHNTFPLVCWDVVASRFSSQLTKLLDCSPIKVTMIDISHNHNLETNQVNLDAYMEKEQAGAVIVHDTHLVLVACLSPRLCKEVYHIGASFSNLDLSLSESIISGIKLIGNSDSMQISEKLVYTANFGASVRPQSRQKSSSPETMEVIKAMGGCRRGSTFSIPKDVTTVDGHIKKLYQENYFPIFHQKSIAPEDRWYGRRANGKKPRLPRFSSSFASWKKISLFSPLKSSITKKSLLPEASAAKWESDTRSMSEWILSEVFGCLPFGMSAHIAAARLRKAVVMAQRHSIKLPFATLCRPLPKGACGLQSAKELHDDGNAAIIPGIWTSVVGNPDVFLRFLGRGLNVKLAATQHRFCWFYGWVPHKSEVNGLLPGNRSRKPSNAGKMVGCLNNLERIHHSAFTKPEIEFIAFSLLSNAKLEETVLSFSP